MVVEARGAGKECLGALRGVSQAEPRKAKFEPGNANEEELIQPETSLDKKQGGCGSVVRLSQIESEVGTQGIGVQFARDQVAKG